MTAGGVIASVSVEAIALESATVIDHDNRPLDPVAVLAHLRLPSLRHPGWACPE